MSAKIIQTMRFEYACDECGKTLDAESTPAGWASVNTDSYAAIGGRLALHRDICSDCIQLDKYAWVLA